MSEFGSASVGAIAHVEMGQAPPSRYVFDRPVEGAGPFLQGNADFGDVSPQPRFWCTKPSKVARAGDSLISVRAPVGEVNLADQVYVIGRGLAAIRFEGIDARYGAHQLLLQRRALSRVAQGSTFDAVSSADIKRLVIPVPSREGQVRIAEILDAAANGIRTTREAAKKLTRIRAGLLGDLMTRGIDAEGGVRPPACEAPDLYVGTPYGPRPCAWRVDRLDHVAQRGSGHTPNKNIPSYWNGGIKWVSLADSSKLDKIYIHNTDKEISQAGIANSSAVLHEAGTVVLSRDAGVGKSAILGGEMAVSQHFMAWRAGPDLDNVFLYYWLQFMKPAFEAIALGSTIQTIGLPYFKNLDIPIPPRHEQEMIAERLLAADQALISEMRLETFLERHYDGLSVDLLTGRVSVPAGAHS